VEQPPQRISTGTIAITPGYYATTAAWVPNTHHDWVGLEQMCTDEEWEKFSEELCLEKLNKEEYVY
jgi:hypothetical protein